MIKKIKKEELWNLETTFAEYILPRLVAFRKMKRTGVPMVYKTIDQFNADIDKMIFAFKGILNPENSYVNYSKEIKEGLKLFIDRLPCLWD